MKPYSDFAPRRSMQIVADLVALLTLGAVVWADVALYQLVDGLGAIGRQLEAAGAAFKAAMSDLGTTLGGVPLIGPGIRAPFDGASGAGAALESAGQNQHVAMSQLAAGLGIGAIALPAAVILAVWLIPRIRFGRRAAQVQELARTSAGIDLLALRADRPQAVGAPTGRSRAARGLAPRG